MKTQKSSPLAQSDSKRLQRFMMAAPAAVAAVGGASITKADAAGIVYFDIPDQTFTLNSPQFNVGNINLTGGGSYDHTTSGSYFAVRYTSTEKPRVNSGNSTTVDFLRDASIYGQGLQLLSAGATIDSSSATWGTYLGYFDSPVALTPTSWQNANQTGYIGLRINLGGSNYNYGWAGFSYDDAGNLLTFSDFAFESATNTAITAGAIPEPANSALLLAAGAAGVLAFRRRKREQAA